MSKEEHVAPTGSDGTTTDLAEPDAATSSSGDASETTELLYFQRVGPNY